MTLSLLQTYINLRQYYLVTDDLAETHDLITTPNVAQPNTREDDRKRTRKRKGKVPAANDSTRKTTKRRIIPRKTTGTRANRRDTREQTEHIADDNAHELNDVMDIVLVNMVLNPLYTLKWSNWRRFLAAFIVVILSTIVAVLAYVVPYLVVFLFVPMLLSYRNSSNMLELHIFDGKRATKCQHLMCIHLQSSLMAVFLVCLMCTYIYCVACKRTLSNALWDNNSTVSMQVFIHHLESLAYDMLLKVQIANVNLYHWLTYIIKLVLF